MDRSRCSLVSQNLLERGKIHFCQSQGVLAIIAVRPVLQRIDQVEELAAKLLFDPIDRSLLRDLVNIDLKVLCHGQHEGLVVVPGPIGQIQGGPGRQEDFTYQFAGLSVGPALHLHTANRGNPVLEEHLDVFETDPVGIPVVLHFTDEIPQVLPCRRHREIVAFNALGRIGIDSSSGPGSPTKQTFNTRIIEHLGKAEHGQIQAMRGILGSFQSLDLLRLKRHRRTMELSISHLGRGSADVIDVLWFDQHSLFNGRREPAQALEQVSVLRIEHVLGVFLEANLALILRQDTSSNQTLENLSRNALGNALGIAFRCIAIYLQAPVFGDQVRQITLGRCGPGSLIEPSNMLGSFGLVDTQGPCQIFSIEVPALALSR